MLLPTQYSEQRGLPGSVTGNKRSLVTPLQSKGNPLKKDLCSIRLGNIFC